MNTGCVRIWLAWLCLSLCASAQDSNSPVRSEPNSIDQKISRINQRLSQAGVSDQTILKHQMMVTSRILPLDPEALLAAKYKLNLSGLQISKLQAIADKARQDSNAVLTPDQARIAAGMQSEPNTVIQMQDSLMNTVMKNMPRPTGTRVLPNDPNRARLHQQHRMKMMDSNDPNSTSKSAVEPQARSLCPIDGQSAAGQFKTIYQGKTVSFCSGSCLDQFKKDPHKFMNSMPQFSSHR